jgi:hypothetical protein
MQMRLRAAVTTAAISLLTAFLSGCGTIGSSTPNVAGTFQVNGKLHGGQQPVSGATIQLYAASATTNAGMATPLLTQPRTTDLLGNFSITSDYTCPASNPLVYIVATGGNPGLATNGTVVNNSALAMMSLLGTCNDLLAAGDYQYIFINEFSTIASVQFLGAFMTDYAHVGSAANNPNALAGAFQSFAYEVDVTTGQYQGGPSELYVTDLQVNTLANIIAACINSNGTGNPCSTLLTDTSSTDTVTAALHMVKSPGTNTAALYSLVPAGPPFQPYFSSVPSDFTTIVGYPLPANVLAGALDSNGQIWLYTGGYSYNTVTDTSTDLPGTITVYNNNFSPIFTITQATTAPGPGGLYYPTTLTADAHGHVFATNANNTISEFAADFSAVSPATGWSTGVTTTFSPSGPGNGYVDGSADIGTIAIDATGSVFGETPYGSSNCYFETNPSGVVDTPAGNICTTIGANFRDITTDGAANIWLQGSSIIAKADTSGNLAVTAPTSKGCFYPTQNISHSSNQELADEAVTIGLLYDHVNGHLVGRSETGVGAITDAGAAVFCTYGTAMPALPVYRSTSTTPGDAYSAGSAVVVTGALDGAGNYFFVTGSTASTGVVGNVPDTFTGTATYSAFLGEISPTGAVLTPYNASTKVYGLQPSGFGTNATATSTNTAISPTGNESAFLLGVDKYGNIWGEDILNGNIIKITGGLATANIVNY